MSLTTEHLLSSDSWQGVLKMFGNRYGVMKVFIDELGEEDNFPFEDHDLEAKAFNQQGLDFIKATLESLDTELNLDFELVETKADSDLKIHFANSPSNSWAYRTIGYSSIGDDIQWTENIIVLDADWWYASSDQAAASDTWEHSVPFLHNLGGALGLEYVNNANDGDSFGGDENNPTTEESLMAWGRPESGYTQTEFQAIDIEALQAIWGVEDNSDNYDTGDLSFSILQSPAIGDTLSVIVEQDDPDGLNEITNHYWQGSLDAGQTWTPLGYSSELPIGKWHENYQIRLQLTYEDGHGFTERVTSNVADAIGVDDSVSALQADPHLLSTDSFIKDLQSFGSRYGNLNIFIDQSAETTTFPFDNDSLTAQPITEKGVSYIRETLETLDPLLELDFTIVDNRDNSDLSILFAEHAQQNGWGGSSSGYHYVNDSIEWTSNDIVLYSNWWYAESDHAAASESWEYSVPFLHLLGQRLGLESITHTTDGDSFGDNQLPTTESSLMAFGYPQESGYTQTFYQDIDIEALQMIWGEEGNKSGYDTGDLDISIDPDPVQSIILTREPQFPYDIAAPDVYSDHEARTSVGTLSTGLTLKSEISSDDPDGYSDYEKKSRPGSWRAPRTRDKQYTWEASYDGGEQWHSIAATQDLQLQPWHQNAQFKVTTNYLDGHGFKETVVSDRSTDPLTIDLGDAPSGWEIYLLPSTQNIDAFNFYTSNESKINVWIDTEGESTELWGGRWHDSFPGGTKSITAIPIAEENQNDIQNVFNRLNDLLDIEFVLVDTPQNQELTLRINGRKEEDTDGWSFGGYTWFYTTDEDGNLTGVDIPYMDVSMTIFEDGLFDYHTLLHEIGHALGLDHPMQNNGGSKATGDMFFPTHVETVMAYNRGLYDHPNDEDKSDIWFTDADMHSLQALWGDGNGEFPVFATEEDTQAANTHAYALISGNGDIDNSLFEVQGNQLLLMETPENGDQMTYSIRIRSTDPDGNTIDQPVVIDSFQRQEYEDHTHGDDDHQEADDDTTEGVENAEDTVDELEEDDHQGDDHSDNSLPTDVDGDGSFHPLSDGLLISSAAQAIEIAAETESQSGSFNRNLHDQLINPNGSRNTTDAVKGFIKDAITSGSLDRNNNSVLDLQDAQRILRDGLGTYPGDAATAGLREPPVPAGTTNSELINEQEQLDALDDSLEAIALMAEAGPQFQRFRGGGGS